MAGDEVRHWAGSARGSKLCAGHHLLPEGSCSQSPNSQVSTPQDCRTVVLRVGGGDAMAATAHSLTGYSTSVARHCCKARRCRHCKPWSLVIPVIMALDLTSPPGLPLGAAPCRQGPGPFVVGTANSCKASRYSVRLHAASPLKLHAIWLTRPRTSRRQHVFQRSVCHYCSS